MTLPLEPIVMLTCNICHKSFPAMEFGSHPCKPMTACIAFGIATYGIFKLAKFFKFL